MEQCEKRVAVYSKDMFHAELPDVEGMLIIGTNLNSFKQIQTIFMLHIIHMREDVEEIESHITDVRPGAGIHHIVVHGDGEVGLFMVPEPIVAIIEIDGPDDIWTKVVLERILQLKVHGTCFLYCHSNPIIMLEQLLNGGAVVEWCSFGIGYRDAGIRIEHGVEVCLYWIDGLKIPVFHLSDEIMTSAIGRFCDECVADEGRMHRITSAEVLEARVGAADRSRLIDHQVFMYYLSGKTAWGAVQEARERAGGCGR
jgi:hypothetical protein